MENSYDEPLLSNRDGGGGGQGVLINSRGSSFGSLFVDEGDIQPINKVADFFREFSVESKKLWLLAGPAIFTSICQYSLGAITQVFAGQVGTLDLAAVSVENSVIAGFSFGWNNCKDPKGKINAIIKEELIKKWLGMGSALETLCGQAFGAGQHDMLGIYMQRSWVILNTTAIILCFLYIFAEPFLKLIGQDKQIAEAAGIFSIYMIPQLFAYAMNFPIAKFLQAQSKMMVMALISFVALLLHTFFSWLVMLKLGWGLVGAAVVLNVSWWFIVVAQLLYIFSGTCGRAWSGFSWKAFQNLWGFVRLSLASAVMLCLEVWYFMALILFAGYLKNPEVAVDALSICMNILGWAVMVALGCNAATSVRVSNELGAGHPRTAKFSVIVVVITSFVIGLILSLILIITRKQYPVAFTSSKDVRELVYALTPLLALSIIINNVQPVLSGVAIGAGWQALVAYVNIGCYYLFGIPLGLILGYKLDFGVRGIWCGMLAGTVVQTIVLIAMTYKTNWNKEASIAGDRIRQWGGEPDGKDNKVERKV
ncbi:Multi antimicrobial extrusion protein [Macleaya cordata]|uniref:Protein DETOXIFICATION n=1 Tax=Macleaya cordata TaxID=56857 RepID=A0A200RD52_MACCD|nr:Multi antimicrobial extrusion protein [Macleaya cordata]